MGTYAVIDVYTGVGVADGNVILNEDGTIDASANSHIQLIDVSGLGLNIYGTASIDENHNVTVEDDGKIAGFELPKNVTITFPAGNMFGIRGGADSIRVSVGSVIVSDNQRYTVNSGYATVDKYGRVTFGEGAEIDKEQIRASATYMLILMRMNLRYDIEVTATEGGSVTTEGKETVRFGKSQTYTIVPEEGYVVKSVIVDGKDMGALTEYTFTKVKADHTLWVTFEKNA